MEMAFSFSAAIESNAPRTRISINLVEQYTHWCRVRLAVMNSASRRDGTWVQIIFPI